MTKDQAWLTQKCKMSQMANKTLKRKPEFEDLETSPWLLRLNPLTIHQCHTIYNAHCTISCRLAVHNDQHKINVT